MQIHATVQTPLPTPPPLVVTLTLEMSVQEAKILRALLGNMDYSKKAHAVATALDAPPANKTDTATATLADVLSTQIAHKLADAVKGF